MKAINKRHQSLVNRAVKNIGICDSNTDNYSKRISYKMKTLFINGLQFKFDRIIEFEQTDTNLLECFFFKGGEIVTSQFLTLFELNNIRNEQN